MKESEFQSKLKKEIQDLFPGCYILKTDPSQKQGMPDLLILFKDKWAALECKRSSTASHRPNQDYRIKELGSMSYASFIYPENKEVVLDELCRSFKIQRDTCSVEPK